MNILIGTVQVLEFVIVDANGDVVPGLGDTFSILISKNRGAFATGTGIKGEISKGWYFYELTMAETNTTGPLAFDISGDGGFQRIIHYVVGYASLISTGPHILTIAEAATVLRCAEDDPNMLMLLPGIDAYIGMGTGWDWALDDPVNEMAKNAARMLMKMWHEDPSMTGNQVVATLGPGFNAVMLQLKVLAMELLELAGSV